MAVAPTTKQYTISLPYGLALSAELLAKRKGRTVSELFQEAVRAYSRQRSDAILAEITDYATTRNPMGYSEEDVPGLIKELRAARAVEANGEIVEEIELNGQKVRTLKSLLRRGLRAVFVGLNPSLISVERGHYIKANSDSDSGPDSANTTLR
jgi:predicted DNA-binding protein